MGAPGAAQTTLDPDHLKDACTRSESIDLFRAGRRGSSLPACWPIDPGVARR